METEFISCREIIIQFFFMLAPIVTLFFDTRATISSIKVAQNRQKYIFLRKNKSYSKDK